MKKPSQNVIKPYLLVRMARVGSVANFSRSFLPNE
jgi:hypothetical protein